MFEESEKFFRVHSNLPINERKNVVVVIDNQPISWNIAYIEIKNKTKLGERILKKMAELEFI